MFLKDLQQAIDDWKNNTPWWKKFVSPFRWGNPFFMPKSIAELYHLEQELRKSNSGGQDRSTFVLSEDDKNEIQKIIRDRNNRHSASTRNPNSNASKIFKTIQGMLSEVSKEEAVSSSRPTSPPKAAPSPSLTSSFSKKEVAEKLCAEIRDLSIKDPSCLALELNRKATKYGYPLATLLKDVSAAMTLKTRLGDMFFNSISCIIVAEYIVSQCKRYSKAANGNDQVFYGFLQKAAQLRSVSIENLLANQDAKTILMSNEKIKTAIEKFSSSTQVKPSPTHLPPKAPVSSKVFQHPLKTAQETAHYLFDNRQRLSSNGMISLDDFITALDQAARTYSQQKYSLIDLLREENSAARRILLQQGRIQNIIPAAIAQHIVSRVSNYLNAASEACQKMNLKTEKNQQQYCDETMAIFVEILVLSVQDKGFDILGLLGDPDARKILCENKYTSAAILHFLRQQQPKSHHQMPREEVRAAGLLTRAHIPVEKRTSPNAIRKAALRVARENHPDKNPAADQDIMKAAAQIIQKAKEGELANFLAEHYPDQFTANQNGENLQNISPTW
jgi:hypothetical protein